MILKDNERVERRFGGMGSDGRVKIFWLMFVFEQVFSGLSNVDMGFSLIEKLLG